MLTTSPGSRCTVRTAILLILFAVVPVSAWSIPAASDAPPEISKELQAVMNARIGEILSQRNADGEPFKRAIASRSYRRVDDNTYQVGLHVDSAMGTELVTERYVVTLKAGADGDWAITNEELKDTYKGLYRGVLGDEDCDHFSSFSLQREGLILKATNGSLCKDYYRDQVARISVAADDLSYEYAPPMETQDLLFRIMKKEDPPDLVFPPDYLTISCDPATCQDLLSTAFTAPVTAKLDDVDQPLQNAYKEFEDNARKNLKGNPFWAFRRPYEPDRRTYTVSIKKKGMADHWLSVDYDNYEPKEVSLWVTGYGPVFRYYSEATRASGVNPYDLELRPDADALDYDLTSLKGTVEMGFGDGETLVGDITYGMKTKRELREIPFGIARIFQTDEKKQRKNPTMTIDSVQDADGNELTWVRTGVYSGLVVLPERVPDGTALTFRLQFENRDSIYKLTPTFSYVDRGGWLPFVRFSDLIDDFDLTVKVPAKYKTLGIGKLVSEEKKDGVLTTRWVSSSPVSFPTVIYGTYVELEPKVEAKKLDGTPIPVTMHIDKDSLGREVGTLVETGNRPAPEVTEVMVVTWKISQRVAQKFVNEAAAALNLYRQVYGVDYPFSKLDLVNDPLGGFYGQAPSSLVYLGNPDFWGKGTSAGLLEGGAGLSTFQDSVVAHEVAHQWWGSLVANANFANYWFVESLAEYSAALFTENAYGKKKYLEHVEAWRKRILDLDMRASVQDGYTVWGGPDGIRSNLAGLYAKGPYAFHIMRSTWGDELFFKFLKNLAQELKGKQIVTRDIQKVAEQTFGANLDWFFNQWLRGVGLPEFTFTYNVRTAEDGSIVMEGQVTQRVLIKPEVAVKEELEGQYFTGIIPITIVGKSGKEYRKRLIIEGKTTPFKFAIPEKPKDVIFNRDGDELAYDVIVRTSS